jgi:hypothetical protein
VPIVDVVDTPELVDLLLIDTASSVSRVSLAIAVSQESFFPLSLSLSLSFSAELGEAFFELELLTELREEYGGGGDAEGIGGEEVKDKRTSRGAQGWMKERKGAPQNDYIQCALILARPSSHHITLATTQQQLGVYPRQVCTHHACLYRTWKQQQKACCNDLFQKHNH